MRDVEDIVKLGGVSLIFDLGGWGVLLLSIPQRATYAECWRNHNILLRRSGNTLRSDWLSCSRPYCHTACLGSTKAICRVLNNDNYNGRCATFILAA